MEDRFVLDSPALEAAVKYRSNTSYPGRRPGKNSLDDSPAFGGGNAAYNGYFTLKDVSTYNEDGTVKEHRVAVCDGWTWDEEKQESGDSTYYVAGESANRHVPSTILTIPNSGAIFLRYCHGTKSADIVFRKEFPYGNTGYYYVELGTIKIDSKGMAITPLHGIGKTTTRVALDSRITLYSYASLCTLIPVIEVKDYTGFFCIRFIEPEAEPDGTVGDPVSFAICDGDTWDPEKKTSRPSYATVNTWDYPLECQVMEINNNSYVAVRYDYASHSIQGYIGEYPRNKYDEEAYAVIGQFDGSRKYFSQKHKGGTLMIWAFSYTCGGGQND